ncbi:hypothetical protein MBLNU230_g6320t1 [Neophaeotheca triangularis]
MASDPPPPQYAHKPLMTDAELIEHTKKQLDEHDQRQAKVAADAGELPQDGATLDLSHTGIRALPDEMFALIKDKVARLALAHNPDLSVPRQIVQCNRLRYLNLRWNELTHFPEAVLQLSSLEILDISKNKIISVPEDIKNMSSLKFLAVARNRITRLPLALGEMNSLNKLKFDENPIEFPPPEALRPQEDRFVTSIEYEQEKDICQQVKRFLRQAALREKLRTNSEEDLSERNAETPRPLKRTLGGRFPVRPSVSGIENPPEPARSPSEGLSSAPQRSHSRITSQTGLFPPKRPGIAPLLTGSNDLSRSRSETVSSSASLRARRQGFVPTRTNRSATPVDTVSRTSSRSSTASTIKPEHANHSSIASSLNGYLAASNGDDSSGGMSPVDGQVGRFNAGQGLESLPESRNSRLQTSDAVEAGKRLLHILHGLHQSIVPVGRTLEQNSPQRHAFERNLLDVGTRLDDLERLLDRIANNLITGTKQEQEAFRDVVAMSMAAVKSYAAIVGTLRRYVRPSVSGQNAMYVRELMMRAFYGMTEARNVCKFLGMFVKPTDTRTRTSKSWSSRTATPTQVKPVAGGRRNRAATIRQDPTSFQRAKPPVVSLHGSRSNTFTSTTPVQAATPRSGESYYNSMSTSSSAAPSRAPTMQPHSHEDDTEEFERIFFKLRNATDTMSRALPQCHSEFSYRKEHAESLGSGHTTSQWWSLVLTKCDSVAISNTALMNRLANIKVNDPVVRSQRDFWSHCDSFVQSWADLATEVKEIGQQRIDIQSLRTLMKPIQRIVKEVSKTISDSPLYQSAIRQPQPYLSMSSAASTAPSSFVSTDSRSTPAAFSSFNSSFGSTTANTSTSASAAGSGYTTPVPATPLSAALGPAVQATVANGGAQGQGQGEYFPQQQQGYGTVRPTHRHGQGYGQGHERGYERNEAGGGGGWGRR